MIVPGGVSEAFSLEPDGRGGFEVLLTSDIGLLERLMGAVRGCMAASGCEKAAVFKMDAVVEEVFANICHYAYREGHGPVSVRLGFCNGDAIIVFMDSGIPFDPIVRNECSGGGEHPETRVGGLGIRMVLGFVDSAEYSRDDGRNILVLTMKGVAPDFGIRKRRFRRFGSSPLSDELLLHGCELCAKHADLGLQFGYPVGLRIRELVVHELVVLAFDAGFLDHYARDAYDGAVVGDVLEDDGSGANAHIVSDGYVSEDRCVASDNDMVPDGGVPLAFAGGDPS